jgi:PAS domain S-box-containing protein
VRFWRGRAAAAKACGGVSQAAAAGASREELIQAVVQALKEKTDADRIGVWTAETAGEDVLQGYLWDSQQEALPAEWTRLSPESIFLREPAGHGNSFEQDLIGAEDQPIIGPLVDMSRAIWTPIAIQGQCQGWLLVASRRRDATFDKKAIESLAGEFALALQAEGLKSSARRSSADLSFARRVLAAAGSGAEPEHLLREIVQEGVEDAGVGFLALGRLIHEDDSTPVFAWESGEPRWSAQLQSDPLQRLWRRALETRRAVGAAPAEGLPEDDYARWVAIPIRQGAGSLGVMLAGLRRGRASLRVLEWLELRAALAGEILAQWKIREEEANRKARELGPVEKAKEPLLLFDPAGNIVALSEGAKRLLRDPAVETGAHFVDLFREPARADEWAGGLRDVAPRGTEPLEGELQSGLRVRARFLLAAGDDLTLVLLEPWEPGAGAGPADPGESGLRTLLEWLEQGVVIFDADERIRAMNRRFAEIAGLDREEARSIRTLDALIERISGVADDPETLARRWRELAQLEEGGILEELHLAHPVPRILERVARPVRDLSGRRMGWLEIYRDLTAERVFQSRLQQAEKLAAVGLMVTGVAHELSNPLTSILGYAQRLLMRRDISESSEVQNIYDEAGRASRMLRQLLHSSREVRPERKPISLNQLVLRALEFRRFGLPADQIRVGTDLDPALPLLLGDADQLQQVVMNLVANAQQAIEHGRGRGSIRVSTRRNGEGRVRLEVADDGPGIPPALLARIFDPFFTTKPAGLGTGLGLAIVLNIVREHGGQVHPANLPEGGALFAVELPALEQIRTVPRPRAIRSMPAIVPAAPPPEAAATSPRIAARVLIVEDEPTVARLIADVLRDEGMLVETLFDGREALAVAAQRSFDLVICDLKMPGLDGRSLYEALARMGSPLCGRFIFVTGDALAVPVLDFLERNRLPYVHKPFRVEELTQAVHSVLKTDAGVRPRQAAARKHS